MVKKIGIASLSAVLVLGLYSCGGGSDYGEDFDKKSCKYMENQPFDNVEGACGDGLIKCRHCDIGDVIISLSDKYDTDGAAASAETAKLKELKKTQKKYIADIYEDEKAELEKAIKLIKEYAKQDGI